MALDRVLIEPEIAVIPEGYAVPLNQIEAFQTLLADVRHQASQLLEMIASVEGDTAGSLPGPWCGYLCQALVAIDRADAEMQELLDAERPTRALHANCDLNG